MIINGLRSIFSPANPTRSHTVLLSLSHIIAYASSIRYEIFSGGLFFFRIPIFSPFFTWTSIHGMPTNNRIRSQIRNDTNQDNGRKFTDWTIFPNVKYFNPHYSPIGNCFIFVDLERTGVVSYEENVLNPSVSVYFYIHVCYYDIFPVGDGRERSLRKRGSGVYRIDPRRQWLCIRSGTAAPDDPVDRITVSEKRRFLKNPFDAEMMDFIFGEKRRRQRRWSFFDQFDRNVNFL